MGNKILLFILSIMLMACTQSKLFKHDSAKRSVDNYLSSANSPYGKSAKAVIMHGDEAVPFIIEEAKCDDQCNSQNLELLIEIVGKMDESVKKLIANRIIKELNSPSISTKNKENLLGLFYKIGAAGMYVEDQLYELREKNPGLQTTFDFVFIWIKSKYSGKVFASYLRTAPNIHMLIKLAQVGPAGADAGPVVIDLLSHPDKEIRFEAARTLGYLQYADAAPLLIPLMTDNSDVRLNWMAAIALGAIAQPTSIVSLEQVSESHWHPAVKNAARDAANWIKNDQKHDTPNNRFSLDYHGYHRLDIESCEEILLSHATEDPSIKLIKSSSAGDLEALTYDTYILSYGPSDAKEQREKNPNGVIVVDHNNIVEYKREIKQVPDVALKIDDGWIVGSSRGEWGGELVFIPNNEKAIKLLDTNVQNIYKFGKAYIVITGLSHLGISRGEIFQLERVGNEWYLEPWITLPGAPRSSSYVETGEILINTHRTGSILLSESGHLRMAPCKPVTDPATRINRVGNK